MGNSLSNEKPIQHVFIIGAKSLGQYGGFESFVKGLVENHKNEGAISYHVACKANGYGYMDEKKLKGIKVLKTDRAGKVKEFAYKNAHIFKITCPNFGSATAIYYDYKALLYSIHYCKKNDIESPIFYILTCRIGLFINGLTKKIKSIGGRCYLNPDGHEWMRAKWSKPVKRYWKWSEKRMVNKADLVVCDSMSIEKYIKKVYNHEHTTYISYGVSSDLKTPKYKSKFEKWLNDNKIEKDNYYLVVGRLVPDNNYETMIREFMSSNTSRDLVLITNTNGYIEELNKKINWKKDKRIKFVGSVYDKALLNEVRKNAFGYIHGHEVGGTNPSLLEAMGLTNLNLLLDVSFNREVGMNDVFYWTKDNGSLRNLIDNIDDMSLEERIECGDKAKIRIRSAYSWDNIGEKYKKLWLGE